jgi:hypothetical protein
MAGSHPHSKKGRARDTETEAERLSAADEVAADLRRQVAILAEQVRALGTSEAAGAAAPVAAPAAEPRVSATAADLTLPADLPLPAAPLPAAPLPRPAASAPPQQRKRQEPEPPTTPAPQSEPQPPPAAARETFAERSSHLVESVVTLAELAAVEIRASAEIEAAAVRARSAEKLSASSTGHLLTLLERQRNMLAALAAQTERLEQAAAVLRAQIRALQAEREHIAEVLSDSFLAP